ncbi:hypothetical protein LZP73_01110 [Shewanella sp. AS16]|uniref:hypothetical protein n=1 Tax=Shewanella sp. AS16 TaxID=2907625 RepID=UPI001F2AB870|nr:hypothetical protein [Shewanella sp. AS16]MCE9684813.1 hypothetical protein [Shewanella sp. AS16]
MINVYFILAAILATLLSLLQLTVVKSRVLAPLLQSRLHDTAKQMLHCMYHWISVLFLLSALVLWACGLALVSSMHAFALVLFLALIYGIFVIWQLYLLRLNRAEDAWLAWYQGMSLLLICLLCLAGLFMR